MINSAKAIYRQALFLILFFTLAFRINAHADTTTGLVGWWRFDEGTGTVSTEDRSGKGNTGTLVNSPTWVAGIRGNALSFNGTSQYVDAGTSATLNPIAISVSAWVYPTALTNAYNTIVQRGGPVTFYEYFIKSSGKLAVYCSTSNYDGTGTNTLVIGQWYHIVFTYDNATGLKGYVNGAVDGTAASVGNLGATAASVVIGKDNQTAGRFFNAKIDDVRIYNRALTAQDVYMLYLSDNRIRNAVMSNVQFK